ncbi:MAG: hypothetical protein ACJAV6_000292 [Candidatus Paceibacteria bacterium]|jgi:hypothetical protein
MNKLNMVLGVLMGYTTPMNITNYLPSKKTQIIIAILLVALIGSLVYFFFAEKMEDTTSNLIDVVDVGNERSGKYYVDTDNDGAYDWEEVLWAELDPENPDSDGDGVLDGKYIQLKRDLTEQERRGDVAVESDLDETEKLGRSTLTALMAVLQSGGGLDAEEEAQFTKNISEYISGLTLGERLYTRDQFSLVEDTQENTYTYRDEMKALFTKYPIAAVDIELLIQATENPFSYQGGLRSGSQKYNEYLSELVALYVPYSIAGRHTELVNNVSQINAGYENLMQEETDDLVSLALIVQIEGIINSSVEAIIKINTFFDVINDPSVFN